MKAIQTVLLIFLFLSACKDPFLPDVDSPPTGYLVVEGNINSGVGATIIKLSRTSVLNRLSKAETSAEVQIIGEDLRVYTLSGNGEGVYKSGILNLPKQRYRLRIKTGGKEYLSSLLEEKPTPPIDNITWQRDADGVKLFVHTHDETNKARYYKWTFEETWEIRSSHLSPFGFKPTLTPDGRKVLTPFKRTSEEEEMLFFCWKTLVSNQILLGSTAKQAKDIITYPITFIPNNDERLVYLYSINVQQIALDSDSYNFYKNLKENTESNGSIFDRQPSEIKSNIRCVNNPEEVVIGNVMLTSIQEKRIFIEAMPNWKHPVLCDERLDRVDNHPDTILKYASGRIPTEAIYSAGSFPIAFLLISKNCADCTTRGSNIKPPFWPK